MIRPTIGRLLYYRPHRHMDGNLALSDADHCVGLVVYVHNERMINLLVTDHMGQQHPRTSVPLLQGTDSLPDDGGYAFWMPYQTSKAAEKLPSLS